MNPNVLFPPLLYKLRRALGAKPVSLAQAARRVWDIAPGADEPVAPIPILPEHLKKIRGGSFGESVRSVLQRITAPRNAARPTRAYLLHDITLVNNALYGRLYKEDLFKGPGWHAAVTAPPRHFQRAALATTYASARWFGHFLRDELSLQELLRTFDEPSVGHQRPTYRHEPGWRAALGIDSPPLLPAAHFDQLIILDDKGENPAKRARYAAMRAQLAQHMNGKTGHERIFLHRPAGGATRRLRNQDHLLARLQREGFVCVDPTRLSVEQILEQAFGARAIVSIEGSHAAILYYLLAGRGTALFINSPERVNVATAIIATFFGLSGRIAVGDGPETDFTIDPDEVMRLLDQKPAD